MKGWTGLMTEMTKNLIFQVLRVIYLPLINEVPGNFDTILSLYVMQQKIPPKSSRKQLSWHYKLSVTFALDTSNMPSEIMRRIVSICKYTLQLYWAETQDTSLEEYHYKFFVASAKKWTLHLVSLPPTRSCAAAHIPGVQANSKMEKQCTITNRMGLGHWGRINDTWSSIITIRWCKEYSL